MRQGVSISTCGPMRWQVNVPKELRRGDGSPKKLTLLRRDFPSLAQANVEFDRQFAILKQEKAGLKMIMNTRHAKVTQLPISKPKETLHVTLVDSSTEYIKVADLNACEIQPAVRTTLPALHALLAKIASTKLVVPIVVVLHRGKYIICDGHRRKAACEHLGILEIPCLVVKGVDPIVMFADLNTGARIVSGREWLTAWAKSSSRQHLLDVMPKKPAKRIKDCVELFTELELEKMGLDGNNAPEICVAIRMALAVLLRHYAENPKVQILNDQHVSIWVRDHKQQKDIKALSGQITPARAKRLYNRIVENKPLVDSDLR